MVVVVIVIDGGRRNSAGADGWSVEAWCVGASKKQEALTRRGVLGQVWAGTLRWPGQEQLELSFHLPRGQKATRSNRSNRV